MTSCRIGCVGLSSYSFFLIILRPPRYTRTDTLFPYTRHFRWRSRGARSPAIAVIAIARSRRRRSRRVCIFGRLWVTAIATPLRDNDLWDRRRDAGSMRCGEITGAADHARQRTAELFAEPVRGRDEAFQIGRERPAHRSEESRVGKECVRTCRSLWVPDH